MAKSRRKNGRVHTNHARPRLPRNPRLDNAYQLDLFPVSPSTPLLSPSLSFQPSGSWSRTAPKKTNRLLPPVQQAEPNRAYLRSFNAYSHLAPTRPSALTRALVCASRQTRKEVLHALHKTGKTGQKRPVRTAKSLINCRG